MNLFCVAMIWKNWAALVFYISASMVRVAVAQLPQNNGVSQLPVFKDTLRLTLPQAEQLFLERNLALLAQRLNVEVTKAQIISAKLWPNPVVTYEMNIFNPADKRWFRTGTFSDSAGGKTSLASPTGNPNGEVQFQIDQVIQTAGKRSKLVANNRKIAEVAEYTYYDALRTLKYTLRQDFYQISQYLNSLQVFDREARSLDFLVNQISAQVNRGNVSRKELIRLEALQFSLVASLKDLRNQLYSTEAEFRTLLRLPVEVNIQPIITKQDTTFVEELPSLDSLNSVALFARQDLKAAESQVQQSNLNYTYQRSLAYPDLDVHLIYDRLGNFVRNYTGIGVATGIPVLNRNQGNIQGAKVGIKAAEANLENTQQQVLNQVTAAYKQYLIIRETANKYEIPFQAQYDEFFQLLVQNFERRNISLLEFIDFFESYRDNKLKAYQLIQELQSGKENVNYAVGEDILK